MYMYAFIGIVILTVRGIGFSGQPRSRQQLEAGRSRTASSCTRRFLETVHVRLDHARASDPLRKHLRTQTHIPSLHVGKLLASGGSFVVVRGQGTTC